MALPDSVTGWAQDEHLALTGSFHMGVGVGVAAFDLTESGAGTLLRFSFRALGVVDTEIAGAMSRGWAELVGTRLKGLVEIGTRLGIDPDEPPMIRSAREAQPSRPSRSFRQGTVRVTRPDQQKEQ